MRNLKKLSRNELKDLKGGEPLNASFDLGGNCWVYERNTLQGNASDYKGGGSGSCKNPPSGYHCKRYTAMGGC